MRLRLALALVVLTAPAFAETPPAGSPAALNQHPRLFVTQGNRAAIRAYIHANYSTEFQNFLNLLGTGINGEPDLNDEKQVENTWGPVNYAFPVALDVDELKALGYTFPAAFDTPAELCAKSYYYLTTDTTDGPTYCTAAAPCKTQLFHLGNWPTSKPGTTNTITTYTNKSPDAVLEVPALAYDWCHAEFSLAQRTAIADAYWEHYLDKWDREDVRTTTVGGLLDKHTIGGRWMNNANDLMFGLAAWGDKDIDSTRRQTLYDTFHTFWIERHMWEVNKLSPEGWNYHPGTDYWAYGQFNFYRPATMIDTALGTTYTRDLPWYSEAGRGLAAWRFPEGYDKTTGCGVTGTTTCPPYQEPWGWNTYTLAPAPSQVCRATQQTIGFLRFWGMDSEASYARWAYDYFDGRTSRCDPVTRNASTVTATHWSTDVWYYFLFGPDGVAPAAPPIKAVEYGYGYFIFRENWNADDAHVFFGAQALVSGGHDANFLGHFSLNKFGRLALMAGNHRSGACIPTVPAAPWMRHPYQNVMGIHTGGDDTYLQPTSSMASDPDFAALGQTNLFQQAGLPPTHSSTDRYSYVHYDSSKAWAGEATKMQREFTYLRGATNHEYLVILDRANVANVTNDPIWKMWVTAQPACVDAACANPRAGKWTTTGKVVSVTNAHPPTDHIGTIGASIVGINSGWLMPQTHGRLFVKALLPADARVQMLGDDGTMTKMFQSGNDDGTIITTSSCPTGHYEIYGWGRIEVRPSQPRTTNIFLNVIQFGDAQTLAIMAPSDSVESSDGSFVVARIADTERNRVVVLAKDAAAGPSTAAISYAFLPTTQESDHLVLNLAPSATYYVATGGSPVRTISISRANNGGVPSTADQAGALSFQVSGGTVAAAPRAPSGIRVQ